MSNDNTKADAIKAVEIARETTAYAAKDANEAEAARAAAYAVVSRASSTVTDRAAAHAAVARAASATASAAYTTRAVANDADAYYTELLQLLEQVQPEQIKKLEPRQVQLPLERYMVGDGSVITSNL